MEMGVKGEGSLGSKFLTMLLGMISESPNEGETSQVSSQEDLVKNFTEERNKSAMITTV